MLQESGTEVFLLGCVSPPTEELIRPASYAPAGEICVETFLAILSNLWYPNLYRNWE